MLLTIQHDTTYRYAPGVEIAQHIAHLKPRNALTQQVHQASLRVSPEPDWQKEHEDVFGNVRSFFSIQSRHDALHISASSLIETRTIATDENGAHKTPSWEAVREHFRYHASASWDPATEYTFPSQYVLWHPAFAEFIRPIFTPQRPLLEAAIDLMTRIHQEVKYVSQSTDINTPAHEALARRQGVCQDFAHIFLSCVRSLGLAARYVSGYLLTEPPEGQPRLIGSDASHAWVSLYIPEFDGNGLALRGQWFDLDPTNNRWGLGSPGEDYILLALGRDYDDVSPVRGVIRGGAHHFLEVGVTVAPVDAATVLMK
jgi:transglutaminase-like putative cysteine protease